MRATAVFTVALVLGFVASAVPVARAEVATQQEMELVCRNWMSYMVHQRGGWAGETEPKIVDVQEIVAGDMVLARCFSIAPRGYVVVPVLKDLPPVKAYSEEYGLHVSRTIGFPQLLREVLEDRVRLFIWKYGSLDASQPPTGEVLFDRVNRREWDRFLLDPREFKVGLGAGAFAPLTEVGPLLTTAWHQSGPYNDLCPMGDGDRTYVGCVATAAAQVLNYHQWPPNGVGDHTYYWDGDDSCGASPPYPGARPLAADFSDAYDWANMPDDCDSGCSSVEEDALAELCYEVGVMFEMDYGACGSGAWPEHALSGFPPFFRYDPAIDREDRSDHTAATWFGVIQEEINAGRPTLYTIHNHAIVCDGWRDTGGQNEYHMNYGWGGSHTVWYTVDNLYCPWSGCDPMVEYMIRNIEPFPSSDCNSNGIPDYQDIWIGTSLDCNANAVPDECDIVSGTSQDCQPDGVPDECQITDVVVLPDGGSCLPTANGGANWCDDFESYPTGSIQGLNGWQGWGPGTGDPSLAGIVTTEQNHTAGGSRCLKIEQRDTVHLFEGYNTGTSRFWVLSAWVYVPSSMTGIAWFIIQADYDGGEAGTRWAVQLKMDPVAGMITSTEAWLASGPLITDRWVEIWLEINFEHDLVAIHYNDVLLGAHTWTMGGGSLNIATVDLYSPDSSGFYYDDLSFSLADGVDCNTNGVPDECDIDSGISEDCNSNAIPDECEDDCNTNGFPDECDITAGTSADCNTNGVPDECASEDDCNTNGFPDECDLAAGTSRDCNTNGVPDECETTAWGDCDCGGTADLLDFAQFTLCMAGPADPAIPLHCTCVDFDRDGDVDLYDYGVFQQVFVLVDCNANELHDRLETFYGLSPDCNENFVPDECDIAAGTSQDADGNGTPDECETRWYVDEDAAGTNDGSSWANAFNDLQDALAAAQPGAGVLWVAEGVYRPDAGNGSRAATFQLRDGVSVYGGFNGTEAAFYQRDPALNVTILSGDLDEDDGLDFASNEENSYHVVTADGTDPTAVLDGFTIMGGNANGSSPPNNRGAGIHSDSSSATIRNCVIMANAAAGAGGMYVAAGSPSLSKCVFTENITTEWAGGGINNNGGSPTLTNCLIHGNVATLQAGGFNNRTGGTPLLMNCTISDNVAGSDGGGMYNIGGSVPTLTNCIFWGNTDSGPQDESAQIYNDSGMIVVNYSCILGWTGGFGGAGNIGGDPLFVAGPTADYYLSQTAAGQAQESPCVDAGDPGSPLIDGTTRTDLVPDVAPVDIGCHYATPDCNTNGVPDAQDIAAGTSEDCNSNGVPDECEPYEDCNTNGIQDICDVASGTSEDCNGNSIPDECDIAAGTSTDSNGDGIPDECQFSMRFVDANAMAGGDGLSWATAYADLQDALAEASGPGSVVAEIRVAAGTYTPTGPGGNRVATFQLIDAVIVEGGYAGIGAPDPNLRDLDSNASILSGDLNNDDGPSFANNDENSYHVVTADGTDPTAVLDGFTIMGGNANGSSAPNNRGAGIHDDGGSATIGNCIVLANAAKSAGGMYVVAGSLLISNCVFTENITTQWAGGAINNEGGSPTLTNCLIHGNVATLQAGGFNNRTGGTPLLMNCTISGNVAGSDGGGMYNTGSSIPTLTNCIFWGNTDSGPQDESAQVYNDSGTILVDYSCILGWTGGFGGTGNIGDNPLFVAGPIGDYYLSQTAAGQAQESPCVDAGNPASPLIDGTTRTDSVLDVVPVDMGYHYRAGGT